MELRYLKRPKVHRVHDNYAKNWVLTKLNKISVYAIIYLSGDILCIHNTEKVIL